MPLWQAVFGYNGGALSYYALFYRSRLVPRWLSGWGMAGVVLLMPACLLALFSDNLVTRYTLLILPIALHEMALAVWLLASRDWRSLLRKGNARRASRRVSYGFPAQ